MRRLFTAFLLLSCFLAYAGPARTGKIMLRQPDGSCFYAKIYGDEHLKIKTTLSGEAIIQEEDGWWCYGTYDDSGRKTSSGCRVGAPVSSDLLNSSRQIPFATLSERATHKRQAMQRSRIRAIDSFRKLASSDQQTEKAGLVILAQFQDRKFKYTKQDFTNMLTQEGYSVNGATGSAKEYFDDQFRGKFNFSFDVSEIVTLKKLTSYYGGNDPDTGDDSKPHEMITEACQLADAEVEFSKYDQDGDGEVDNVFIFFAGEDEAAGADEDAIWSHAWYVKDGARVTLKLDHVLINRYACTSELEGLNTGKIAGIGTFCHEYTHTFGLPDFYDTDYNEGGYAAGLWQSTALMDAGNYNNNGNTPPYFNAIEREILGISEPVVITAAGEYELPPINEGIYYRINTSQKDEYFLLEYRDGKGWDEHIRGKGMLVYHIDKSDVISGYSPIFESDITAAQRWLYQVEINALASHQCADLIEADKRKDAYSNYDDDSYYTLLSSLQGIFFPNGRVNSLTPQSSPGLKCWGSTTVNWGLSGIAEQDGKIVFQAVRYSEDELPSPINIVKDIFQDEAIISFQSSLAYEGDAKIEFGPSGGRMQTMTLHSYKKGNWAFALEGLQPTTSYSLKISFEKDGASGQAEETSFMTKKQVKNNLPYIYLGSVKKNDDGTFPNGCKLPLKIFNASEAEEIKWFYNGTAISRDKDCYYTVSKDGRLTAHIYWADGSMEIIVKDIKVN